MSAMITYSFEIIDLLLISFIVSCREHVSMYVPKEQVMEKRNASEARSFSRDDSACSDICPPTLRPKKSAIITASH